MKKILQTKNLVKCLEGVHSKISPKSFYQAPLKERLSCIFFDDNKVTSSRLVTRKGVGNSAKDDTAAAIKALLT